MPKVVKSLLLWLVLLAVPLQGEAKTYLLSVGISDYPGSQNDLRLPHNDAATMQWVYQQSKYAQTMLLTNSQAKLATVKAALRNMVAKATANDIVVLFFSGHGVPGGFVCYDGILNYGSIYSAMAACKSRNKMIFADACFAGAMRQNSNTRNQGGGVRKNSNVMLFLSCRGNEVSIESRKLTNGFFTYALQHGLRGGADANHNRIITAKELFDYVSARVKRMSGNQQHPVMWGRFPDNMPVMRW